MYLTAVTWVNLTPYLRKPPGKKSSSLSLLEMFTLKGSHFQYERMTRVSNVAQASYSAVLF
jgi:hypothetical protein